MKSLIFLFFIVPFSLFSQGQAPRSLSDLIREYEKMCNQLVPDTLEQIGHVYIVLNEAEQSFKTDTVWQEVKCKNCKEGCFSLGYTVNYLNAISVLPGTGLALYKDNSGFIRVLSDTKEHEKTMVPVVDNNGDQIVVKRPFICNIPLKTLQPFGPDFWNWVKNQ